MKILIILTIVVLLVFNLALFGDSKPAKKKEIHKSITKGTKVNGKITVVDNIAYSKGPVKIHPGFSTGSKVISSKTTITKRIKKTGKGRPKITKKISKVYMKPKTVAKPLGRVSVPVKSLSLKKMKSPMLPKLENKNINITKTINRNILTPLPFKPASQVLEESNIAINLLSSPRSTEVISKELTIESILQPSEANIAITKDLVSMEVNLGLSTEPENFQLVTESNETPATAVDSEEDLTLSPKSNEESTEITLNDSTEQATEIGISLEVEESETNPSSGESNETTPSTDESTEGNPSSELSTESTITTEKSTESTASPEKFTEITTLVAGSSESSSEEFTATTPAVEEPTANTVFSEGSTETEIIPAEEESTESTVSSTESSENVISDEESTETSNSPPEDSTDLVSEESTTQVTSTSATDVDVSIDVFTENYIFDSSNETASIESDDTIAININETKFVTTEDILNVISNEASFEVSKIINSVSDTSLPSSTENQVNEISIVKDIAQSPDVSFSKTVDISSIENGVETQSTADVPSMDLEITKTVNETMKILDDDATVERDARSARRNKNFMKKIMISKGETVHGKRVHRDFRETYFLLQ